MKPEHRNKFRLIFEVSSAESTGPINRRGRLNRRLDIEQSSVQNVSLSSPAEKVAMDTRPVQRNASCATRKGAIFMRSLLAAKHIFENYPGLVPTTAGAYCLIITGAPTDMRPLLDDVRKGASGITWFHWVAENTVAVFFPRGDYSTA